MLGVASAGIGKGHLPGGQMLVTAGIRAHESRHQDRRPLRVKQTKSHRIDEFARLVQRADRPPVQAPFFPAQFL